TAQSTPLSVCATIRFGTSSLLGSKVQFAPTVIAKFRRFSITSTPKTDAPPYSLNNSTRVKPTGPKPKTAAVSPALIPTFLKARIQQAVGSTYEADSKFNSDTIR